MTESGPAAVVVLAAGEGKRMKSELAKVLHAICGRSLLGHVLVAAEPLGAASTARRRRSRPRRRWSRTSPRSSRRAVPVVQAEQHGTGHAVRLALDALG